MKSNRPFVTFLSRLPFVLIWITSFLVCISLSMNGCDDEQGMVEVEDTSEDTGPIFFEPTYDMSVQRDLDPGEVSRILGEFGDPCEGNLDCAEGWCVDSGEENICTRTCIGDNCPNGWNCRAVSNNSQDVTLICVPQDVRLCKRCDQDSDCPAGLCYELDNDRVCGSGCVMDSDCPPNYVCSEQEPSGDNLCTPLSGSCTCSIQSEGENRICEQSSSSGTCYGRQNCQGVEGWSTCTAPLPTSEICNQIDDDCNGITDDIEGIGEGCAQEAMINGELRSCEGIYLCIEGEDQPQCTAQRPMVEVCNFLDDDCDGQIDEDFDGRDQVCSVGEGACKSYGVLICNDEARPAEDSETEWTPLVCNALEGVAEDEICDGVDNDCDGQQDESILSLGNICYAGMGICQSAGVTLCDSNDPTAAPVCSVVAQMDAAEPEVCNLVNDDCDLEIDEDFKVNGLYALDHACGNCFTDCTHIFDRPNGRGVCEVNQNIPSCALSCNQGYYNLNGVPDDGCEFQLDINAVYVSETDPQASDDPTCGGGPTQSGGMRYPCASITYALTNRSAGKKRILVANGTYEELVTVINGIDLFGGYRANNWERNIAASATVIRSNASEGDVKTLIASGISSPTVIEGFLIYGINAVTEGANSYGVYIVDSDESLILRDNVVFAGAGAAGDQGRDGFSGQVGVEGSSGRDTFYTFFCLVGTIQNGGGFGGVKSCGNPDGNGNRTVSGGDGGSSVCPDQNIQEGSGGNGANNGGLGGPGGWGHYTPSSCYPTADVPETGTEGRDGVIQNNGDGNGGMGCLESEALGEVIDGEWRSGSGSLGTHGQHGTGGGGGGGGGGQQLSFGYDIGGSGGGGGSGGCAAQRGGGGNGGGGSFGIFIYFDTLSPSRLTELPTVTNNSIHRNLGGNGGDGGNGGAGGDPGAGALGGGLSDFDGPSFCIFPGAKGGFGSRGGHGGGGGGGCGGASYDIVAWGLGGLAPNYDDRNVFPILANNQTSGDGGSGGNSSNTTTGLGIDGQIGRYGHLLLVP
jgi:hypothetical protein